MACRHVKRIVLSWALVVLLTGCGSSVQESDIADRVYIYEKDGFGGDFTITLNGDSTFSYSEGLFSSYLGIGKWTLEGDVLCLEDDEKLALPLVNYFRIEGNDLVFQAEDSSNFRYIEVADGERFSGRDTR